MWMKMGRLTESNYSFSHSEMATYKQCKRKWMMQYYWKLRRKREPKALARDTGIVVHEALHLYYTAGGLRGEYSESIMDEFLTNVRDEDMLKVGTLQEDPETVKKERKAVKEIHETARILCNGYVEWLKETGADIGLILDKSEVELRAPGPVVESYVKQIYHRLVDDGRLIFTYAIGDEVAPRSYQVAATDQALEWCHMFGSVQTLATPVQHPNWNWMVARK